MYAKYDRNPSVLSQDIGQTPFAHFQKMTKSSVKFQNYLPKTAGGVSKRLAKKCRRSCAHKTSTVNC